MSHPSRVRVTGPLTSFTEGFAAELSRQGYRPNAAANQLQLLAHLSRWLAAKSLNATSLTASVLKEFPGCKTLAGLHAVALTEGTGPACRLHAWPWVRTAGAEGGVEPDGGAAGSFRGRMVLSSPNSLALFFCQSDSPKGLWRFTDSRIEASWLADNGSSTWANQFTSTSTGQGSVSSLRHPLDHGQSSTDAAKPDLTGFCKT